MASHLSRRNASYIPCILNMSCNLSALMSHGVMLCPRCSSPGTSQEPKKPEEQKATPKKAPVNEPGEATAEEIEAGKGLAAISYISILFLIPMISMRDNRFAMFHARQSMVLVISAMVLWLGLFLLGMLTSWLGIGILLILLSYVVLFAWLVLMIIGFVKAFSGEYWRIPLISDWADKVKF